MLILSCARSLYNAAADWNITGSVLLTPVNLQQPNKHHPPAHLDWRTHMWDLITLE